jgi:hypothetical protein
VSNLKGDVVVTVGKTGYIARPTFAFQSDVETKLDRSIVEITSSLVAEAGKPLKATELAVILRCAIEHGPNETPPSLEKVGEFCVREGYHKAQALVQELLFPLIAGTERAQKILENLAESEEAEEGKGE